MSTNYYFIPPDGQPFFKRHIGKSWFGGPERGGQFTWAMQPQEFDRLLEAQPTLQVGDSYAHVVPIAEFKREVLDHIRGHHLDLVGQVFS